MCHACTWMRGFYANLDLNVIFFCEAYSGANGSIFTFCIKKLSSVCLSFWNMCSGWNFSSTCTNWNVQTASLSLKLIRIQQTYGAHFCHPNIFSCCFYIFFCSLCYKIINFSVWLMLPCWQVCNLSALIQTPFVGNLRSVWTKTS